MGATALRATARWRAVAVVLLMVFSSRVRAAGLLGLEARVAADAVGGHTGVLDQRTSAVRWVASKLKFTVFDRFWKVLSAAVGRVSVTRRFEVAPTALSAVVAAARSRRTSSR